MTRTKIFVLGLLVAMFGLFAAPATAQDEPAQTLTVEPASVEAAGETTFTVTGTGFTLSPVFVLPGTAPESCDAADADLTTADTGALTPVVPDADGNITAEVTFDVPEGGILIIAGEATQTEGAWAVVCVGDAAAAEGGDEAAAEETAEETTEEPAEELAVTGVESGALAIVGLAVVAGGAMVVGTSRRFS